MITTVDYHNDDDLYYLQIGDDQTGTEGHWMTQEDLDILLSQINDAIDLACNGIDFENLAL